MTKISIILGVSVVLMLFMFLLVGHHRDIPDRVRQDRSELLGAGSSPVGQVSVPAADSQREPVKKAAGAPVARRASTTDGGRGSSSRTTFNNTTMDSASMGSADTGRLQGFGCDSKIS